MSDIERVPTTRWELASHLDAVGVRADCYHLFGAHLDDAMVMDHRPEGWVVFYSERGSEWSPAVHARETDACADLLARVCKSDHNFFALVVGPAPAETADTEWAAWLRGHGAGLKDLEAHEWKYDDVPWTAGPRWRRYFVRITAIRRLQRPSG